MFDAEGAEIFGAVDARVAETFDVSVGEGIGDLQRHAQQHGEDEEDGHLALFEEGEGAQPEQIDDRLAASRPVDRAVRQRERVETQYEAQGRREVELGCTQAHLSEIDDPHGTDESDRAPHADGREVGYGIQSCFFEGVVGDRIGQCDGGHIEHYAQQDERVKRIVVGSGGGEGDESCGEEMAEAQETLRRNPSVSDDSHDGRHK